MGKDIIKSKNFILRPPRMSDAQTLLEIETDKENKKNMMTYTDNIKKIKSDLKKLKNKSSHETFFIIEVGSKPVGYISIHGSGDSSLEHQAFISYAMHPKYRGKGIMTQVVRIIINYAFHKYHLKRLTARCRTFNKASAKVLEKAGFHLEGIHKKELKKGGKYLDNMHWSIVK